MMTNNEHVSQDLEGWEPVRADELSDFESPSLDEGRYAGVIGVGGLILWS